jgi:hypothetical protein
MLLSSSSLDCGEMPGWLNGWNLRVAGAPCHLSCFQEPEFCNTGMSAYNQSHIGNAPNIAVRIIELGSDWMYDKMILGSVKQDWRAKVYHSDEGYTCRTTANKGWPWLSQHQFSWLSEATTQKCFIQGHCLRPFILIAAQCLCMSHSALRLFALASWVQVWLTYILADCIINMTVTFTSIVYLT